MEVFWWLHCVVEARLHGEEVWMILNFEEFPWFGCAPTVMLTATE